MSQRDDRPNILFIMTDQLRADFLGCAGADFLQTPNLDTLAAGGVRFTRCMTNSPVCAPARIGLAAGLQPARLGALDNMSFLPFSTRTYYQRLRDAGYRVGCVGKLDLAKPDPYNGRRGDRPWPYAWGFTDPEECEGKMHAGNFDEPQGPYGFHLQQHGLFGKFRQDYARRAAEGWSTSAWDSVLPTEFFEDAYIGRRAAEWIREVPDDFPWHYFVSFVGPHDPFDPPEEYADLYCDANVPLPAEDPGEGKPDWVSRRMGEYDEDTLKHTRRQYCAEIQLIDDAVGSMLDALEARGMLQDTFVIFSSDHGEMLGDHGLYAKSVPYAGALNVPLIVNGPGLAQGLVSDALVELIDVNPTICELAGLPPQENIDARSLGPVIRGSSREHREDAVTALRNFRAIVTDRYKFVQNYNDRDELYDLQQDPAELRNLAGEQPELARELGRRLAGRFTEGGNRR